MFRGNDDWLLLVFYASHHPFSILINQSHHITSWAIHRFQLIYSFCFSSSYFTLCACRAMGTNFDIGIGLRVWSGKHVAEKRNRFMTFNHASILNSMDPHNLYANICTDAHVLNAHAHIFTTRINNSSFS